MNKLSAGVQILIDQLKTNPEEFFGPLVDPDENYAIPRSHATPKFRRWATAIEDDLLKIDDPREKLKPTMGRTWFLTEEEKSALLQAYTEARRVRFDAEVVAALYAKPEPKSYVPQTAAINSALVSGVGITRLEAGGVITNNPINPPWPQP